jgi:hypothetical protein
LAISSRHWRQIAEGQTISTKSTRWRSTSSCRTSPASMVLPRPTSSAMNRLARGSSRAFFSGMSWWSHELDAGAERGLEEVGVGGGDAVPAERVEVGAEVRGGSRRLDVAEAAGVGSEHARAELELPEHLEGTALVSSSGEADQGLLAGMGGWEDVLDQVLAVAHQDHVTGLGRVGAVGRGGEGRGVRLGDLSPKAAIRRLASSARDLPESPRAKRRQAARSSSRPRVGISEATSRVGGRPDGPW